MNCARSKLREATIQNAKHKNIAAICLLLFELHFLLLLPQLEILQLDLLCSCSRSFVAFSKEIVCGDGRFRVPFARLLEHSEFHNICLSSAAFEHVR